jgi:hypothetical protein
MTDEIFHRVETNIQTPELAVLQVKSGEIWGKETRYGGVPVVQAYRRELDPGKRGIQFTSSVKPHPGGGTPLEARWYLKWTEGVLLRQKGNQDFAAIPATVENKQP